MLLSPNGALFYVRIITLFCLVATARIAASTGQGAGSRSSAGAASSQSSRSVKDYCFSYFITVASEKVKSRCPSLEIKRVEIRIMQ